MNINQVWEALIKWSRIKHRVHPAMLKTDKAFDPNTRKHLLQIVILFKCDTASDCEKIENFFRYVYENFEELKDKPSVSSLKTLLRI